MKGFIPESKIEEIRNRADIVGIVSEYVTLRKAGRNHVGSCPFHKEKTPSFTVNSEKQIFYCFGCGQGGNAFAFLMKMNDMTFPEAMKHLADKLGIPIPDTRDPAEKQHSRLKQKIYRINALARDFFTRHLASAEGRAARDYLGKQKIREEVIREFRIGYAPGGWRSLRDFFQKSGVALPLAEKAGLIIRKDTGDYYDRFRGRVIFPIEDVQGNAIAFGGRVIGEGDPKYLNSPESPVYVKGQNLYGLNRSRDDIRRKDSVIVVEGYFDFLSLWNAGIQNVAATLGTALTAQHTDLIKRYTKNVFTLFDPDQGGRGALERSLGLFLSKNVHAKVVILPPEHDPDTFARSRGREALEKILSEARSAVDYYIDDMIGSGRTLEDHVDALRAAVPFMARIEDPVEKNLFIRRVSERLNIDLELLKAEVGKATGAKADAGPAVQSRGGPRVDVDAVELSLVAMMVENPSRIDEASENRILDFFMNEPLRHLGSVRRDMRESGRRINVADFIEGLENGTVRKRLLEQVLSEKPSDEQISGRLFTDTVRKVKLRWYKEKHKELKVKLLKAQERGDSERCNELLKEKERLLNEQKAL